MRKIGVFISAIALGFCEFILGRSHDQALGLKQPDQAWAEAIWASLIVNSDDETAAVDEAFDRAIRQTRSKAPVLVAMARAVSGPKKVGDLMNRFVEDYSRGKVRGDRQINEHIGSLSKLIRGETSEVEQCYLAAIQSDPTYKPAWFELVKSDDREKSQEALAALKRLDPDNALLDYLQATDAIKSLGVDAALVHIQAGNAKSACRVYPNRLPTRFMLRYPDSEAFQKYGVVGRPISPLALAYLVKKEADLWAWSDREIQHRLRHLSRQLIATCEDRIQQDEFDRAESMLLAQKVLGYRLLLEETGDVSLAIMGLAYISYANDILVNLYCRTSREKSLSLEREMADFRRAHGALMLTFDRIKPEEEDIRAFLLGARDAITEERAAFRTAFRAFLLQ